VKTIPLALTLSAILALPSPAPAGDITQVTLWIEGIHTKEDGRFITERLSRVPNAKVANAPTPGEPEVVVVPLEGATYDVGDLAIVVAQSPTPNRKKGPPSATLVLRSRVSTESFLQVTRNMRELLANVKGVDASQSDATKSKTLHIKLDDKGGAKLSEIKAAFPMADLD
jgi:hypothetical protein